MYENELVERRVAALTFFVLAAAVIILVRLLFLQVIQGREFVTIATENKVREVSLDAVRGDVYDRNGVLMVGNRPSFVVSMTDVQAAMSETDIKERDDVIRRLGGVLGMTPQAIKARLQNRRIDPYKPVPIKEDVNEQVAVFLKEHQLDFPHVQIEGKPVREYPNGNTAAHILGYLGEVTDEELKQPKFNNYHMGDVIGREGVELSYEKELAGRSGVERIEVNAAGYPVSTTTLRDPKPGQNITMTIDKNLQALSENLLVTILKPI